VVRHFDLTLGLPHTNRRGLWEPLLLMHAGHFHWQTIAATIGRPLSSLVTRDGSAVYAAFYFLETVFPDHLPIESYGLDDTLRFAVTLRAFKNLTMEGQLRFDRASTTPSAPPAAVPYLRFANIFITPKASNRELKIVAPIDADFSSLPVLPNDENPYHLTRAARADGSLGLFASGWTPAAAGFDYYYDIDGDRDTNGAGLVYFANYITFAEAAERAWARATGTAGERSIRHRRMAYYGNAEPDDRIRIRVAPFTCAGRPDRFGARFTIERETDRQLICISEVVKAVAVGR